MLKQNTHLRGGIPGEYIGKHAQTKTDFRHSSKIAKGLNVKTYFTGPYISQDKEL